MPVKQIKQITDYVQLSIPSVTRNIDRTGGCCLEALTRKGHNTYW